jgi:nicotinamide mononucleotide adenylyltransferase
MMIRTLQRHAVDHIKRHALGLSLGSPRAQAAILTEYLWTEEGAESTALHRVTAAAPAWVDKLVTRQLDDERRHAELLRTRLRELEVDTTRPAPALARAKLWWIERACAPYTAAFAAGPVVVLLAVAAQLESTGVRLFGRHLAVLEAHERATTAIDPTADVIRSILADETRHARSCAAAVDRLVRDDERDALDALRTRIGEIDRAFGVTIAVGFWLVVASHVLRDRQATSRAS